ncbi:MAG: hypothetical protein ACJ72E_05400 [Marmoricola sp.]
MWEPDLPDVSEHLRQGDLLDLAAPIRGTSTLTNEWFTVEMKPAMVLVVDHCCTIEQKCTVMVVAVSRQGRPADPEHPMLQALQHVHPVAGEPYAFYEHLLEDLPGILEAHPKKLWLARLLERVSVAAIDHDHLAPLRTARVGRMTRPARAQLRAKMMAHVGRAEAEDAAWLADNGYDEFGVPTA